MNDKQKQIEETAKDLLAVECGVEICEAWHCSGCKYEQYKENYFCESIRKSEALCEKGYRKQSDTAREIKEKIFEKGQFFFSKVFSKDIYEVSFTMTLDEFNKIVAQYGVEVEGGAV